LKKNNFLKAGASITLLIIIIIATLIWFLAPKNLFNVSASGGFGQFKQKKTSKINDSVPESLRWHDSFGTENKNGTRKSYIQYMGEKNKK